MYNVHLTHSLLCFEFVEFTLFILFWNTKCFHPYCKRIYFIFRHTGIRPDKLLFIYSLFALQQSNGKFVRQFKSYG